MRTIRLSIATCLISLIPLNAQAQLKPNMMIVLDSSGSMRDGDLGSNPCTYDDYSANNGVGSKGAAALCALHQMVGSSGDANFGLMSYAPVSCGQLDDVPPILPHTQIPVVTNNAATLLSFFDSIGNEQSALYNFFSGYTPTGHALAAAQNYYEGNTPGLAAPTAVDARAACRSLNVILVTDGMEMCETCEDLPSGESGCPKAEAAFPGELSCPVGCYDGEDPGIGGRHYDSAQERAHELYTETSVPSPSGPLNKAVRTYVIAFGVDPSLTHQRRRIEGIALAGRTDNPASPTERAFYPQNQQELSVALSQIIADAQPPNELCNNLDDDCDSIIDEGVPKFCDLANGITQATLCDSPGETDCDGLDDDCDGVIDEGLLNRCGTCGDVPSEICDGVDNDCDANIDENTGDGSACGSDEGACAAGTVTCISGAESCEGEIGKSDEICDCIDNDCDGRIDEDVTGDLCGDGQCVGCACVGNCTAGAEFQATCETGLTPEFLDNNACVCVVDDCDPENCGTQRLERDGQPACAPDSEGLGACRCRGGSCSAPCDGVTCGGANVCHPKHGQCVPNDCRGLGCDRDDEVCNPGSGQCETDLCAAQTCPADQACREGKCEATCAGVTCESGTCSAGVCVDDPCADLRCTVSQVCDTQKRTCVKNECAGTNCAPGLVCDPIDGACENDPCLTVRCPEQQRCDRGQCIYSAPQTNGSGGSDGAGGSIDADVDSGNSRVLAAGGSGCLCHLSGTQHSETGGNFWVAFGVLALLCVRRTRKTPSARRKLFTALSLIALLGWLLVLGGCKVTPFCLDCLDDEDGGRKSPTGDAGTGGQASGGQQSTGGTLADASVDGGSGGLLGAGGSQDAGAGCIPKVETCNNMDDDCDFKVDEDVKATENNCSQVGACAGGAAVCIAGSFECNFGNDYEGTNETSCDGLDNDCDGKVDEAFPTKGTACDVGIGQCKRTGRLACAATEVALRCDAVAAAGTAEVCDNLDNDCDGLVDEPKSAPGTDPSYVRDEMIQLATDLFVYAYEASRPDATAEIAGDLATRACSRASVYPWTNVTYDEADAACAAAGLELCTVTDWEQACQGPAAAANDRCLWSYYNDSASTCPTENNSDSVIYPANDACNGHDTSAVPGPIGAPNAPLTDQLKATGSMANCFTEHGTARVYDLSGNAKEWVHDPTANSEARTLRGGSHNDLSDAMRCTFALGAASRTVRLPTIGFRCCSNQAP